MRDEIEAACARLAELMRERELLLRRHVELRNRLSAQSTEVTELRARHALGQRNVDRLQGLSLTRVLLALRGGRDELARERAEADAARHRVAEAEARLAAVRAELTTVDGRLARLTGVPARHQGGPRRQGALPARGRRPGGGAADRAGGGARAAGGRAA